MDWFYQCIWPADQSGDVGIRLTLLSNKPLPNMSCRGLLVAFFRLYLKRGDSVLTRHAFSEGMRGNKASSAAHKQRPFFLPEWCRISS